MNGSRPSPANKTRPSKVYVSAAGISVGKKGEHKIAESVRPDGTIRRERLVRPGFVPEEDVKRYKTSEVAGHTRCATEYLLGVPAVQDPLPTTKAAKKNAKRKEAKKKKTSSLENNTPN